MKVGHIEYNLVLRDKDGNIKQKIKHRGVIQ